MYYNDNKIIGELKRIVKVQTQTERITFLSTPDFKTWLSKEASQEGISISKLIRLRCKQKTNEEELLLLALINEVRLATRQARTSLNKGLNDAETVLTELRSAK